MLTYSEINDHQHKVTSKEWCQTD